MQARPTRRNARIYIACFAIGSFPLAMPAATQQRCPGMDGTVTTGDGPPIEGVLVVSSSGFEGWGESKADGTFHLKCVGKCVSFRHAKYKPLLVRTSDLSNPVHVHLTLANHADGTVRKVLPCAVETRNDRNWIGTALRVKTSKHQGPVYGEHDAHWYVHLRDGMLYVVDGYAWHAGLPLEDNLDRTPEISVREWIFNNIVGLDLSGQTTDGGYWRWVGAPMAEAIEYKATDRTTADHFDTVIASMCFQSR